MFEYTIPRIGSRIDNVLIYKGIIFLLEFKVGANEYPRHGIDQAMDYALYLSCFHKQSHNRLLVPILICTEANEKFKEISEAKSNILDIILCNQHNIFKYI